MNYGSLPDSSARPRIGSWSFAESLLSQSHDNSEWLARPVTETTDTKNNSWRIIRRSGEFFQSSGGFGIQRLNRSRALYWADLWHTLLDSPLRIVSLVFFGLYLFVIFVFTLLFWALSETCQLEVGTFSSAWAFSLETIMTIGFGFPEGSKSYFEQCNSVLVLITAESILGCVCDAICVGLVFARLSRAQTRANTVIFSRHAVVRRVHGKLHLMFQAAEMRKHQLVEAHVRCYTVSRHPCRGSESKIYIKTASMRLTKPDDEQGALLFMALPSVISHPIDAFSPLRERSKKEMCRDPSSSYQYPDVLQRECDIENGSRDCLRLNGNQEEEQDFTHEEFSIKDYMSRHKIEIIVLIEGIDAVTSDTIQARHSYCADDILWHHDFAPCALEDASGNVQIDFKEIHTTFEVPEKYRNEAPAYLVSDP